MMRKWKYSGAGAAGLCAVLILTACGPAAEDTGPAEDTFAATPVTVVKVRKQAISEKLFYTGLIEARREVNVTPDVGGKIARIYVDEGDRVTQGQLLAELDTRALRLQLEQAEAGLAVAEFNRKDALRNKERMERLNRENAVSEQQFEKIQLAFEAADAQLQQAAAALNLARHNLEVSLMKAPFAGVVAAKNVEVGDVINPMMGGIGPGSGVLTLMDFSKVKIEIDASLQDVVRIRKNQPVSLRVSAFSDRSFEGRVSLVNMTADPQTRKFKVQVEVDNPDLALRPNTFGEVVLDVETHEGALVIPQKAVLDSGYVFVVDGDTARRREISLGLQNMDLIEVTAGLSEGELVIAEGNFGLEDGSRIVINEDVR